ncbi:MAG: hypothetical protein AAB425_08415, partial [Bdellovibrionota bacterium]
MKPNDLTDADSAILTGDIASNAVVALGDEYKSSEMAAPIDAVIDGMATGIPESGISDAATLDAVGEISAGTTEGLKLAKVADADLPNMVEAASTSITEAIDELKISDENKESAVADVTEGALAGLKTSELSAADSSATKTLFQNVIAAIAGGATKGIVGAGIKSADSAKYTKKIAFASIASMKQMSSTITDAEIASMSQYVTKGIVSKAEVGGIAKADIAAAIAGTQENIMAAFSHLKMPSAQITLGMEALTKGASSALVNFTSLSAAEQASLASTVASSPIAYLSSMNITDETLKADMIKAATKGCVAGIPASRYDSATMALFSKSASEGAMKGVSSFVAADGAKIASYSAYISNGVTSGAAALDMDATKIESFLTSSSQATVAYGGTLGLSANNLKSLSTTYTSKMTEGLA